MSMANRWNKNQYASLQVVRNNFEMRDGELSETWLQ